MSVPKVAQLRQERDILANAAALFARKTAVGISSPAQTLRIFRAEAASEWRNAAAAA